MFTQTGPGHLARMFDGEGQANLLVSAHLGLLDSRKRPHECGHYERHSQGCPFIYLSDAFP
jgi:hypothetical protein